MTAICVERGTFTSEEWMKEAEVEVDEVSPETVFCVGQKVLERR